MHNVQQFSPISRVVHHILLALSHEARHGYGIIKHVSKITEGRIELETGTLYAAVRRLREDGLLREAKAPVGADVRRRYYELTPSGRDVLRHESQRLAEIVELARKAHVLTDPAV